MARRLEIELTSDRGDGSWTWRAVGAKKPKGDVESSLIPDGVAVGDVVKVEAEADLDGLVITEVFAPKTSRKQPQLLELLGSGNDGPLVTTQLAPKGRGRSRRPDGDRGDRDGRGRDKRRGGDSRGDNRRDKPRGGESRGGERPKGDRRPKRGAGSDRSSHSGSRSSGSARPSAPARPKAPRLRPKRTHQSAAVKALPEIQRGLADEVLKGGVPGLRAAVDRMNEKAAAQGMPKIKAQPLVALAETLAPRLKAAEWIDRAEAAIAGIDKIDLRDIRSVVVAAENAGRDQESRDLADQLRAGLTGRVDSEHRKWLDELAKTISDGRTVRALRLSSRPPKAGAPLPTDMAERLGAIASESLTPEISQDRWATVLDAVAYSPVRSLVKPVGRPEKASDELLTAVKKLASRVPEIAAQFGIEPPAARKRGRRPKPPPPPQGAEPAATAEPPAAAVVDAPAEPLVEAPAEPVIEAPTEVSKDIAGDTPTNIAEDISKE